VAVLALRPGGAVPRLEGRTVRRIGAYLHVGIRAVGTEAHPRLHKIPAVRHLGGVHLVPERTVDHCAFAAQEPATNGHTLRIVSVRTLGPIFTRPEAAEVHTVLCLLPRLPGGGAARVDVSKLHTLRRLLLAGRRGLGRGGGLGG